MIYSRYMISFCRFFIGKTAHTDAEFSIKKSSKILLSKKVQSAILPRFTKSLSILTIFIFLIFSLAIPHATYAQINQSVNLDRVVPVQLDLKLIQEATKVIGSPVVSEDNEKYTIVETVFTAEARAFGGDIYLPTYIEDIIFSPHIDVPKKGSNAVVPGTPSIKILKNLPKVKDKYLLKEYDSARIEIKIAFKVLPTAMPSKLSFAPVLNSLVWYPASYPDGAFDPGIDPMTGERLIQFPLAQPITVLQQVTRLDWKGTTVVLWGGQEISAIGNKIGVNKLNLPASSLTANIIGALKQIFQTK